MAHFYNHTTHLVLLRYSTDKMTGEGSCSNRSQVIQEKKSDQGLVLQIIFGCWSKDQFLSLKVRF